MLKGLKGHKVEFKVQLEVKEHKEHKGLKGLKVEFKVQ